MPDLYHFQNEKLDPGLICQYESNLSNNKVPLVVDNGSHTCCAGWATDETPRLKFRNLIAKPKGRKELEQAGVQIGNDIANLENVKWSIKTQFDSNVVTQFDAQEQVFDYMFTQLGLSDETSIDHPVVMTEAVCNPNCCRQRLSELLFECYNVPSLVYGVDSLFSLSKNLPTVDDALVISVGYQTTHIIPVLSGKIVPHHCRRINIGGSSAMGLMHRILHLKYPQHAAELTWTRAQELVESHTHIAADFEKSINAWRNEAYIRENSRTLQLPYIETMNNSTRDQERDRERRFRQGKRLQELNAKRREEKIAKGTARLHSLASALDHLSSDGRAAKSQMKKLGMSSIQELEDEIASLEGSLERARMQSEAQSTAESKLGKDGDNKDERTSATSDTLINPENLEEWLNTLRNERSEILEARRKRQERRQELGVRKSHAFKERMRILSKLAHDGKSSKSQKKPKEDTFGMNDEDWEVYKYISRDESDSDGEQERLTELENILSQNDNQFQSRPTSDSSENEWALYYQLQLTTEQVRVPEIFYQPSILGSEQAGIAETIDFILKKFTEADQERLVKNVFVTGGSSSFRGFDERLRGELLAIRPFQSYFNITHAADPVLDAWNGARQLACRPDDLTHASLTRAEYEEFGGEFVKEHRCSNMNTPTPS